MKALQLKCENGEKGKILIAEDEEAILSGLQKGLTKEGYTVETARDGFEAAEKLKGQEFDIILSDLKMPKLDGIELLQKLRELNKSALFIMITGYATKQNAVEAMKLGAFDYIPKPFTIQEVAKIVNRAVENRKVNETPKEISHKKVDAYHVSSLVAHIMKEASVFGPVAKGQGHVFARIEKAQSLTLDYVTTTLPPKKYLLPTVEELFRFDRKKGSVTAPAGDEKPAVLFGIHPCDMQAILRLDQAFTEGYPEANYLKRRKNMAIVGVSPKADDKSFYSEMGAYDNTHGFDLFLTKHFNGYIIDILTEKGASLLEGFTKLETPTPREVEQAKLINLSQARAKLALGCPVTALPELFSLTKDDPIWEELSSKCLSCGSCSLVCPTCYCFDVTDKMELNLTDGARYRKWDSCQNGEFAEVAGGENFREKREDRVKHRFMHKFGYFGAKFGTAMCVGCGRCTRVCLAGINPMEVIARLAKLNEMVLMSKVFSFMN